MHHIAKRINKTLLFDLKFELNCNCFELFRGKEPTILVGGSLFDGKKQNALH